jgi:hypothetical protein
LITFAATSKLHGATKLSVRDGHQRCFDPDINHVKRIMHLYPKPIIAAISKKIGIILIA